MRRVLVAVGVAATLVSGAAGVALGQPEGGRANVAISLVDAPDPVLTGGSVTYTATVQNAGPHRVDEAKVLLLFPQAASVDAVRANGWHCGPPAASVVCRIDDLDDWGLPDRSQGLADKSQTFPPIMVDVTAPALGGTMTATGFVRAYDRRDPDTSDNTATATTRVDAPPLAKPDSTTTAAVTPVTIPVLSNDTDPDGDVLTVSGNTTPGHGTATCTATACTYTPAAGFEGTDTFQYTAFDGVLGTATALVTITVAPPNPDPTPPPPPPPPPGPDPVTPPPPPPPTGGTTITPPPTTVTPPPAPAATTPSDSGGPFANVQVGVSGPTDVNPGGTAVFQVVVSNACSVIARGVTVRVTLPAGLTPAGKTATERIRGRTIVYRFDRLRRGSQRLRVTVRVAPGFTGLRSLVVWAVSSNSRTVGDGLVLGGAGV